MPGTIISGPLNTYSTALTNGSYPADTAMIEFTNWAEALNRYKTPFLEWLGMGEEVNQPVFYFGQSYNMELESTVGSGGITDSATTLPVATGTGHRFRERDILGLFDTGTNDWTPTEIVRVTAAAANSLTIVRAQGGTTGTAFAEGDRVLWMGNAEAQNEDHIEDTFMRGDRQFNYFQRFSHGVAADKAAQNQPTFEHRTNPMLADFETATMKGKIGLERAVLYGGRQLGTPQVGAKVPSLMGGLDTFITTNSVNNAGAVLTKATFDNVLYDLFNTVDESLAKVMVCSYNTKRLINTWYNPIRMSISTETTAQERVDRLETDFGTFDFKTFQRFPEGVVYILDPSEIIVHPFSGLNWHISAKDGVSHGADHDHKFVSGDFSLEVRNEAALAKLYNFDTDVADYPGFATGNTINVTVAP